MPPVRRRRYTFVRYVILLHIIARVDEYDALKSVLLGYGIQPADREILRRKGHLRVPIEKTDPRLEQIVADLRKIDVDPGRMYAPAFDPWELEQAELVRMRVEGFCGDAFGWWVQRLGLPPGSRVMDKREMGKQDIAKTYAHNEFVISERVREMLEMERFTGWVAEPIQHRDPKRDRFPPLYLFTSSHELPPLAPETELELRTYDNPNDPLDGVHGMVRLYGTTALFERGPLTYRRKALIQVADVNRTHEIFLEVTVAHPYFVMSQRVRQAFLRHRVHGDVSWEPVAMLE